MTDKAVRYRAFSSEFLLSISLTSGQNITYTFNFLAIMASLHIFRLYLVLMKLKPAILINRFIMNLRSLDTAGNMSTTKSLPAEITLGFRQPVSFLGNIGESLARVDESEAEDVDRFNLETPETTSATEEDRPGKC